MNKLILKPGAVRSVQKQASSFLEKNGKNSQESLWLLQDFYQWSLTDYYSHLDQWVGADDLRKIEEQLNQIVEGRPFQYVTGYSHFLGHIYQVTPDVLIPRPETEEWLERALSIVGRYSQALKVLDVGTGSGIIAIEHALSRPDDNVLATDISEAALEVAKQNAEYLDAQLQFIKSDLFEEIEDSHFQIVYSNPPYIAESERDVMTQNVIDYEPPEALFAEEEGLAFYRRFAAVIAEKINLNQHHIFLEIGYLQKEAVIDMMSQVLPHSQITCWTDFNGLDRVIHISRGF